jgi:hypothetical protein
MKAGRLVNRLLEGDPFATGIAMPNLPWIEAADDTSEAKPP